MKYNSQKTFNRTFSPTKVKILNRKLTLLEIVTNNSVLVNVDKTLRVVTGNHYRENNLENM